MAYDLTVLSMAKGLARHASVRQGLVTENVANADTIGFRARDLRPFSSVYQDVMPADAAMRAVSVVQENGQRGLNPAPMPEFAAMATRPGHAGFDAARTNSAGLNAYELAKLEADSPNGNSVSVEDQMARAAEAKLQHGMALGIIRKSMDLLRMSIGRS
ncbi:MAG: flagellar basal body rod protein FlgB [Pseudomonadota bacterium]